MRDRGSAFVLAVLVGVAIAAAVTLALVPVLSDLVEREHARSAADAAALAGVNGGRAASGSIASVNRGTLVAWSRNGRAVTVTVRVGDQQATARATDDP